MSSTLQNEQKEIKISSLDQFNTLFKDFDFHNDFKDIPHSFEAIGAVYTFSEKGGKKTGPSTLTFPSNVILKWWYKMDGTVNSLYERRLPDGSLIKYTRKKDDTDDEWKPHLKATLYLSDLSLITFTYDRGERHGDATLKKAGETIPFKYNRGKAVGLPID